MLHYSCDLCGQRITEQRFIARLEVYPAFDPEAITEDDLDHDNLEEISELLSNMEVTGELNLEDKSPKSFHFDLCESCHRQYRQDPLGRHRTRGMRFSEN